MGILLDRLSAAPVICAEGYLFELERRGYLQAGAFVPEVVLEHPDAVLQLHREFLRAGSDVMVAFTYYAHREKMRLVGKEDLIEPLQLRALELAREVADEKPGTLVCGNICNTNVYEPDDKQTHAATRAMFDEQIGWAVDAGVDFILAETIPWHGEAMMALESAKQSGLDVVVNMVTHSDDEKLRDGVALTDSCKQLVDAGAAVVGLNCCRGPATMLPQLLAIRAALPASAQVAGIPVPYRTDAAHKSFQSIEDTSDQCCVPDGMRPFPVALDAFVCSRFEIAKFTEQCVSNNINLVGVCCGAGPHHVRAMAEALGRAPEASKYSADMSKHYALGTHASLRKSNQTFVPNL